MNKDKLRVLGLIFNLQLFAASEATLNANKTSQQSMSDSMKTFYDTALLENAREAIVFDQFAEKQKIHGNKVEWRKFDTFAPALTPISEGVTPTGSSFGMSNVEATTTQHGDYTTVTDRLEFEAYDDIILGATEEMGAAGGATKDLLTRNVITAGNAVAFAPKSNGTAINSRSALDATCLLTPRLINKARTWLIKNKAPKISNSYVCIIHPSVAEDFRNTDEWKEYHKYNDTAPIFKGEIGEMHGFRFIESNNAKVHAPAIISGTCNKAVVASTSSSSTSLSVTATNGKFAAVASGASIKVWIGGSEKTVTAISISNEGASATLTLSAAASINENTVVCGQGAGKDGSCTYDCICLGSKAYGVVEPEQESMHMIIKDKGAIGGPLELYSTIGYKFSHAAKILYQERILRIECGSSYSSSDEEN